MHPDEFRRAPGPASPFSLLSHHAAMLRALRRLRALACVLPDADPRPAAAAPVHALPVPRAA